MSKKRKTKKNPPTRKLAEKSKLAREAEQELAAYARGDEKTVRAGLLREDEARTAHLSYYELDGLQYTLGRETFQQFTEDFFAVTVRRLRRQKCIRLAFVLYSAAMWCGDELYRFFRNDPRFEVAVYYCLRRDGDQDFVRSEEGLRRYHEDAERLRAHGVELTEVTEDDFELPKPDILFYLTPYDLALPEAFSVKHVHLDTLLCYLPYAARISQWELHSDLPILELAWKHFCETPLIEKEMREVTPWAVMSGYPRLDVFYEKQDWQFDWKMARPDAKKIVYAPHWSIEGGVRYATFQWNYRFFYEYAKNHPETSWVIKPHPNLIFSAVDAGIFASSEEAEAYFRAWDALPNARLVTGPYYQAVFMTSDAMILDSGSFIMEYQYAHRPMLFLRREGEQFNRLGTGILAVNDTVDGKDIAGIENFIRRVVQENDPQKEERENFFLEQLDYRHIHGMSASEYVYQTVCRGIW